MTPSNIKKDLISLNRPIDLGMNQVQTDRVRPGDVAARWMNLQRRLPTPATHRSHLGCRAASPLNVYDPSRAEWRTAFANNRLGKHFRLPK